MSGLFNNDFDVLISAGAAAFVGGASFIAKGGFEKLKSIHLKHFAKTFAKGALFSAIVVITEKAFLTQLMKAPKLGEKLKSHHWLELTVEVSSTLAISVGGLLFSSLYLQRNFSTITKTMAIAVPLLVVTVSSFINHSLKKNSKKTLDDHRAEVGAKAQKWHDMQAKKEALNKNMKASSHEKAKAEKQCQGAYKEYIKAKDELKSFEAAHPESKAEPKVSTPQPGV